MATGHMATSDIVVSSTGAELRRSLPAASPRYGEKALKGFFFLCAALSVAVTTAIVIALLRPAVGFFRVVPLWDFLTGTTWAPSFATPSFGVLPILVGTLLIVGFALAVSVPVGLASAIYLSEYAPRWARKVAKPALEVLEGIPTVAIGLFAFLWLRPQAESLLPFLPWGSLFSTAVAGVAVGFLIIPLVASVSDDALRSVPHGLREGAYALGANKLKVSLRVMFPAALSGITASIVLAASRALGETMVVFMASGAGSPTLSFNPFEGLGTMTGFIAGRSTGDVPRGGIEFDTIFAVGSLLFLMTFTMNMLAIRLVRRFREVYE